ncbi:MAG: T9SS type A sorting domain-containing protein [bacterium]
MKMKNLMITCCMIVLFSFIQIWACSGVYISNSNVKIFGLNEDFYNYNTMFRTMPATATTYGIVGFGHSNSIQAIINEKGLCYDGYGAPEKAVTLNNHLPVNNGSFIFEAMTTCATIEEVVELYNQYYHPWLHNGQIFFTDILGNSVIIEGDAILYKTKEYQICTNFYQSDPQSGIEYGFFPCWRYDLMQTELETTSDYSVEFIKGLLKSVHVENQQCNEGLISTVYSLIIDQNGNKIYVYNFHDFENVVVLDISEELSKSAQSMELSALFLTGVQNELQLPTGIKLNQNYPNPFNPATIISYQLAECVAVRLKIFDSLGNEIATLVNEEKQPGLYAVEWNAIQFSSGIYFCEMIIDNKRKFSSKMLLLR